MPHSRVWDESAPNGALAAADTIDTIFQQLKTDIRERLVDAGLVNFATGDPVGFDKIVMAAAISYVVAGATRLEFRANDGTTVNMTLYNNGDVGIRGLLQITGGVSTVLLLATGLATLQGGLVVTPTGTASIQCPATFTDNVTLTGGQGVITPVTVAASTAALTVDWDSGNNVHIVLTANCTFTFSNPRAGGVYLLRLTQDVTGSRIVTWPASVKWPAGAAAPTLTTTASRTDVVTLYYDGTNYMGVPSGFGYV